MSKKDPHFANEDQSKQNEKPNFILKDASAAYLCYNLFQCSGQDHAISVDWDLKNVTFFGVLSSLVRFIETFDTFIIDLSDDITWQDSG